MRAYSQSHWNFRASMACLYVVVGGKERELMEYRTVLYNGESRASPCDRLRFFLVLTYLSYQAP